MSAVDLLLVEDSDTTVRLIEMLAEAHGYSIAVASNGADALDLLLSGRIRPQLVILDIQLPQVSGLDVVRAIREHPPLAGLPVIAVSAHAMPGDPERFVEAGCNDYMSKPIDTHGFVTMLARYLGPRDDGLRTH